ncbi:MAG TPA: response regulator [Planctomycetes bacterium]|nr:response regulator [Planctomycetota bacterium]
MSWTILARGSNETAIEKRSSRPHLSVKRCSTILLDWNMPQPDPTSILQELRHISPTVRVLVVSGDLSLHAHDIQAKGFSRLLRKPFSCEELVEAVT